RRAQPAPAQTARLGFPDRPSGFLMPRARPEPFPNAAEISRDIEFLTVRTSCRPDVSCLNWLRQHAKIYRPRPRCAPKNPASRGEAGACGPEGQRKVDAPACFTSPG